MKICRHTPRWRAAIFLAPVLFLIASTDRCVAASPAPDSRFEEMSRLIEQKMAEHHIPGVAFGIVKEGARFTRGFGVANIENPNPVTPDTLFTLASISKTVTATAMMRLVEIGKVDLNAPVRRYLPEFRVQDEKTSGEVTVWNLITHTTGWEGELRVPDHGTQTLAHVAGSLGGFVQLAAPGTVWSYDNPGYGVAGRVIEVATGGTIHEAFRNLVFDPLGLDRACSQPGEIMTHRFTTGHTRQDGRNVVSRPYTLFPIPSAGGVAMSVSELLSFAEFHLGRGTPALKGVLSPDTLRRMQMPQVRKFPTDDDYGIAWHLRRVGGVRTVAHGGTYNRHCLHLQLVPERNLAFAILTNHSDGWRLIQEVERATLRAYEGLALGPNQAIAQRGVNEPMTPHATALAVQPDARPYLGDYRRGSGNAIGVRTENGRIVVATGSGPGTPILFFAPDMAFASSNGAAYEFIRDSGGKVGWIRVGNRIARKDRPGQ